ncbi:MAG: Ig-like domain-containing protein [Candidatus Promineifilaceae bacterium]
MRHSFVFRFLPILAAALLLLAACGGAEEATPTAEPTPAAAEAESGDLPAAEEPAAEEPAAQEPTATATAEPEPLVADWAPQVVAFDPAAGEVVSPDSTFTIRFDQPMDQASVEAAWAIDPAVEGQFNWPRSDTLSFAPDKELARGTSYRVQVADSAMAETGMALEDNFEFTSTTAGDLAVQQVMPEDGTQNVQTNGAITVVFNRPVVPLTSSGQQAGLPQPLTFAPAVEGQGEWVTTSVYRFEPGTAGLAGGTSYNVTVDAGLTDVGGGTLPADYTWQFTTEGPDVLMISPPNKAELVAPTRPISITFNMPMDPAGTESAVSLNPAAALDFAWQEDGRLLVATPQEQLALETEYELTINQGAPSANGAAGMAETATSTFTTVPFPGLKTTLPRAGGTADVWQTGVSIEFKSPMDMETLEDRVIISPEPDKVTYSYYQWIDETTPGNASFNLYVEFNLANNAEYTVTIPGDAADIYGNTLGEPYVFEFSAAGYTPLASFNLPANLAQLTTSFPSDVEVIHRNVSQLTVNLYQPDTPLTQLSDLYAYREEVPLPAPLRTWTVPVDTPQDEAAVTTVSLADGEALPTGLYVLTVDAPELSEDFRYWQNQKVILLVADTNVVVSEMPDEAHAWVTDLESGQPAANRAVVFYDVDGNELETTTTDGNGFAGVEREWNPDYRNGVMAISGVPGSEQFGMASSTWMGETNIWQLGLSSGYGPETALFSYLYTDRPIYRPGDTLYFKGILREADYGRYLLPEAQPLALTVSSFSYYSPEQSFEESIEVDVNEQGLFWGEFEIPEDAPLGTYGFYASGTEVDLNRTFTVAEYRKPEFQVMLTPSVDEALRGEAAEVTLQADYFFGGSAANLPVQWTIYEDVYTPDIPGPIYSFSDWGDFNFVDTGFFGPRGGGPFGNYLLDGSGETDENGNLVISLPADLLQDVEEGSRKVTVEARVIDLTEFPVTTNASIVFHAADGYVGIRATDFPATAGTDTNVDLLTVDWHGEPLGNQNVEVVFYEREWESTRDTQYGMYRTTWEPVDTEVARETITTDASGEGSVTFVPPEAGSYVAVATLTDSAGRQQTSTISLWVIDENFAGWRTDPHQRLMELELDRTEFEAGETAQILVKSPFPGPVQAWLMVERGNLVDQQVVTLQGGSTVIDLPLKADYAPNVFVSVVAVKPVTPDDAAQPYADIRLGITEIQVAPDQFDLQVTLTPQELFFEPGDTAAFDVLVTDQQGNPVSADFSLAMVDLAVLTLKEDNAPPILEAFYSPQLLRSQVGSGLFVSGEGLAVEIPLAGGGLGGGGGGDIAEAAVARIDEEEDETRAEFPDTAYWEASVQTGADGTAVVEIPLPDSLTTWRLSSKAVTEETQVGQGSGDVIVTLPLLIRPVTPRFFTVGDVIQLGAVVNNNSDASLEATVSLEADGLTFNGESEQTITVAANGSELVRWEVTVEDVPYADLTFRVQGGDYSDATKPPLGEGPDNLIPVYRYDAQDFTGTAGDLDEEGRRVEAVLLPPNVDPQRGNVAITLNASLAAALLDALDVVERQEIVPSCSQESANRLLANVATAQAVNNLQLDRPELSDRLSELISLDIGTLEAQQKRGGGWGWCYTDESDPWLSAYALLALSKAQDNDFEVNQAVIERGQSYVQRQLDAMEDITDREDANRQAFFLYVLAEAGEDVGSEIDTLVDDHRGLLDPYAKALLILAYETLASGGANQETLLADINDQAILSASGAHWEDAQQDFFNLNSDVRGTAMVIAALSAVEPDSALAAPAVRWLMLARTAEIWSTLHETAWSIFALSDYMAASGELNADYQYALGVNGLSFADGAFNEENLAENKTLEVPVSTLQAQETNFFDFQRGGGPGTLYYTMFLNSFISAETVQATNRGLTVERAYFDAACDPEEETCEPIDEIEVGQQVRVELTVVAPNDLLYAVIEDPLPAGAEGIDPGLDTSSATLAGGVSREDTPFGYWGWWIFNNIEYRDEKVVFLANFLPAGTYQYTYYLDTLIPGEYQVMPAVGYQDFFPDVFGRSDGMLFTINGQQ